jgi:release factor glutamine methyltransferase
MPQALQALDAESLLARGVEMLRNAGIESPRREARLLLAHALSIAADKLISARITVQDSKANAYDALLARRCKHEPLAYITGSREFWSINFFVAPGVLIPRPESETLVEAGLRKFPERDAALRVLDLGTGSGCLLLAFLSERPHARGLGVDLSQTALSVAARNARALSLDRRTRFRRSDWTRDISGRFDIVFANPPYISARELLQLQPDVAQFEPREALDGGEDGLNAYRSIAAGLRPILSLGARIFIEAGQGQAGAVQQIFASVGLAYDGAVSDLAGIPRCVIMSA